eukprot:gb/GECH01004446.1/.p1 GENE.gb/GECH01004446.1/~~gb/GECH01004446.1/.p1  ORF type:complete len:143 (+),score=42.60 gb/GECH01004446.1/:1-429(+)
MTSNQEIPIETIVSFISSPLELSQLSAVSSEWYNVVACQLAWKKAAYRQFKFLPTTHHRNSVQGFTWHAYYIAMLQINSIWRADKYAPSWTINDFLMKQALYLVEKEYKQHRQSIKEKKTNQSKEKGDKDQQEENNESDNKS